MSLDKEIQQRGFRSPYHKTVVNIMYTYHFLMGELNEVFKKYEVTRQQYNVLRILKGQFPNPVSISSIKDRMLDKMSDMSRIIDRLRAKGLVAREHSHNDKRAADIIITQAGLDLLKVMEEPSKKIDEFIFTLSEEECDQLNQLLDRIRLQI